MPRYQQSRHALGSDAHITIVINKDVDPEPTFELLWRYIDAFEQRFSRFKEDSELTLFNRRAGHALVVSVKFRQLLLTAKEMALRTDGVYNPFILPALQHAGYKGSWPDASIAPGTLNYEHRSLASSEDIEVKGKTAHIPKNTALDFGGIGKGYLLDQLSELLQKKGIGNYWVSLGGDIICDGADGDGEPWRIAIQDARDTGKAIASVVTKGAHLAIATSGITKRKGEGWHHIIDPRTNEPAKTDILTATVCTQSATNADIFAKCLVICGSRGTATFGKLHDISDMLLQYDDIHSDVTLQMGTVWSS